MEFAPSPRTLELREQLQAFVEERLLDGAVVYARQVAESGDPHFHPPVMEELKAEARRRGLWNLFHPDAEFGAGLTNLEYAPLCELMGRHPLLGEATNCSAPDTGNMEILGRFGTPLQQEQFLRPLLDGRDPLVLRDDRAVRRQLGRHEPAEPHRARRRPLRDQRSQVVDERGGVAAVQVRDLPGRLRPRRRHLPPAVDDPRPDGHTGRHRRTHAPGLRPRRRRRALRDALGERARPGRVPPRRGGRRVRDRAGAARSGPDPPLHARDRDGREGAGADVRARRRPGSRSASTSPTMPSSSSRSRSRASRSNRRGCSP